MTNIPDYRGRVESGKPQDLLHKIAGIIPGYNGYQDRERRRDADRELRGFLARRFREQHAALMRVQQQMARSGRLTEIGEVDRLGGVLQRFIDKLETATQGYAGLFDPIKVDTAELDQLYTFDAALADGLQQVTDAVAALAAAGRPGGGAAGEGPDLEGALTRLGTVLDDLLTTWNHRNDVIVSGRPLPPDDFNKFRASMSGAQTAPLTGPPPAYAGPPPPTYPPGPSSPPAYAGPPQSQPGGPGYPPAPPPAAGAPGGQPYQPYSGVPQPPAGFDNAETGRLTPPSNVSGPPTGGPTGSGQ